MRADFSELLVSGFQRFYHLPLLPHCEQSCNYCPAIGSKSAERRTSEALDLSVRKAQSAAYSAILVPCNILYHPDAEQILQRLSSSGLHTVVQVNRASLQTTKMYQLQQWQKRYSLVLNFIFDSLDPGDLSVVQKLAADAPFVYFTMIVHRKMQPVALTHSLPREYRDRLYFYFPYEFIDKKHYHSCLEVKEIVEDLRKADTNLMVRPAPGIDPFDPRIPEDRNLEPMIEPRWSLQTPNANIRISVVIPSYNNRRYLKNTVQHLLRQDLRREEFEIVVVDDGSFDNTEQLLRRVFRDDRSPANFKYIFFPRKQPRRMGDNQFRAGVARNLGVKHTSGEVLAFLDSDILVPPLYLRDLLEKHKNYDVIQPKRIQLKKSVSSEFTRYDGVKSGRDTYVTDEGYWESFQNNTSDWMQIDRPWRFVCTYGLSCKRETFAGVGFLRRNYIFYGYEDTEFGMDLYRKGCRFLLNDVKVYHLDHRHNRSEFFKSHRKKKLLLAESARTFYLNTLNDGVYDHLEWLYRPFLWLRVVAKDILGPFVVSLRPLEKLYYAIEYKVRHGHIRWGLLLPLVVLTQLLVRMILSALTLILAPIRKWPIGKWISRPFVKTYWFLEYQISKRLSLAGKD